MKIPRYMTLLVLVAVWLASAGTSEAMMPSYGGWSGGYHGHGEGGGRNFESAGRYSGSSRGSMSFGSSFRARGSFSSAHSYGMIPRSSVVSPPSLNAHVIVFNRSRDGGVTSFTESGGGRQAPVSGALNAGRYRFSYWDGGNRDHDRFFHGRDHDRFFGRDHNRFFGSPFFPFFCAYPLWGYEFYPYWDNGFYDQSAFYDQSGYSTEPPVVTYSDSEPSAVPATVYPPARPVSIYRQYGSEWAQDLRRDIVTWDQFVQYMKAYILTSSADARDEFRQGFIASYGTNAVAAFDKAMEQATEAVSKGAKIVDMPPRG